MLAQDVVNNVTRRGLSACRCWKLAGFQTISNFRLQGPVLNIRPDGDCFAVTKRPRVVHGTPSIITFTSYMRAPSRSPKVYNRTLDNTQVATGPKGLPLQARGGIILAGVTDYGGLPYERRQHV